jgi:AcrR family transcriptional regulator
MPRAFTSDEKERIRSALLRKGRRLFARHGLRRTSVRELTRAVGISQGSFYSFFPSKEDLFFEILEREEREFAGLLLAQLQPGDVGRKRLLEVVRAGLDGYRSNPFLGSLLESGEYEHLRRSIPESRMRRHVNAEVRLVAEAMRGFRARGRSGGSGGTGPKRVVGLLQVLFLLAVHEEEFDPRVFPWLIDRLCELVADSVLGPEIGGRSP